MEAIRLFTQGPEGLKTLPETPEHTLQQLGLQTILGFSLMETRGFPAVEVERPTPERPGCASRWGTPCRSCRSCGGWGRFICSGGSCTRGSSWGNRSHTFRYGCDPGRMCLSLAARTLWLLGYADQARQRSHELLTLIEELSHPFHLANALPFAAMLHYYLGRRKQSKSGQRR